MKSFYGCFPFTYLCINDFNVVKIVVSFPFVDREIDGRLEVKGKLILDGAENWNIYGCLRVSTFQFTTYTSNFPRTI